MQFCALCGDVIALESKIATIYFEIHGIGAFEFNIHAECLITLGEPNQIKNGDSCVFCGTKFADSRFIVRQLDNLDYPVHSSCLEDLLERFASLFCDDMGDMDQNSGFLWPEDTENETSSQIGLIQFETRN